MKIKEDFEIPATPKMLIMYIKVDKHVKRWLKCEESEIPR